MNRLLCILWLLPLFPAAQSLPSIQEKTKNMKAMQGFINFYWDDTNGKIWLEISQMDTEILYQNSLPAGLGSNDVGLDRGILGSTAVVKFTRVGNKVLLIQTNYAYRAVNADAAGKRAVEHSFAQSTLWGFTIEAVDDGNFLVDATAFLLRDAMNVTNSLRNTKQGNYSIDASRSAMYLPRTKNFVRNTEFESTVTFINTDGHPGDYVQSVTPDANAITLRIHHSFVKLPDNNFKPRVYDARCGYFSNTYFDYSTPISEPIQKMLICRHRLQKKDSLLSISEAVQPIIYYVDNGAPEPIRSALMEGAGWWSAAFEAAGFRDAFQVKLLPDSIDPMDTRYNIINWVHRSTRGWSFGSSVIDPRTGEIIKADVTLGSLRVRQDYLIAQGLLSPFTNGMPPNNEMEAMAIQRIRQLAAHEVGHTLGLVHNYIASAQGRTSVMDYPAPMAFINDHGEIDLSNAYTNGIGDWDKVTIDYGYREFLNTTDENAALNSIINTAAKDGLTIISDRDARDPAGLHPTAHLWDNGTDPVSALRLAMSVRAKALSQFGANSIPDGTPMAMLEDVLVPVYLFHRYQLEAVTKQVGGAYYSYALRGDGQLITQSLNKDDQLKALSAVIDCMDPEFLALPERIIDLIPPRPDGYTYTVELFNRRTGLSFDPLAAAESAADFPLSLLFNTNRLNRMVQYEADNNGLGALEMINMLIDKTWKTPVLKGLQGLIQKQNQQLLLTYLLSVSVSDHASFATKSEMMQSLDVINNFTIRQFKSTKDEELKGYLLLTLERLKNPEKAVVTEHTTMPPGSPIGCGTAW